MSEWIRLGLRLGQMFKYCIFFFGFECVLSSSCWELIQCDVKWNSTKSNKTTIQWWPFVYFSLAITLFHQHLLVVSMTTYGCIKSARKTNTKIAHWKCCIECNICFLLELLLGLFVGCRQSYKYSFLHFFLSSFLRYYKSKDFVVWIACAYLYWWVDCWHGNTLLFYVCYVPWRSCTSINKPCCTQFNGNVQLCVQCFSNIRIGMVRFVHFQHCAFCSAIDSWSFDVLHRMCDTVTE